MDNFKAVYRILSQLEQDMDNPKCNLDSISYEQLGVSKERWAKYIEMMSDVGYIKGAQVKRNIYGELLIDCSDMKITLKGLEYLQENSMMQKIYKTIKGVAEIIP
ncbi:MAG: YjcQ family protein [Lachnospiraceae bacterium]